MEYTAQTFAEFAANAAISDIPEAAWSACERAVLDTLASLVGGVPTQNAIATRNAAFAAFGPGKYTSWFANEPLMHFLGALLSNCAAASSLDIDDGHRGAAGHPGAAIVPAVLMEAQHHEADGNQLLAAIIVGYDVALRIAEARHIPKDISFASGIWTGYGVAAALGRLRGLAPIQIAHAMAIAGQEAPQNLPQGACMASSVKGSSPWSTVTATVAVARVQSGASGSLDLLDRDQVYRPNEMTRELGKRWLITETYLKAYASCRYTHPVIDAILELRAENPTGGGAIDRLQVEIFPEAEQLPNAVAPTSLEDAQFSIPFTAALAAMRGEIAFRPLLPSCLEDTDVLELSARVQVNYSAEFDGVFPLETPARVAIIQNGMIREKHIEIPYGDCRRPLSSTQIERKLFDLGRGVLPQDRLQALVIAARKLRGNETKPLFDLLMQ